MHWELFVSFSYDLFQPVSISVIYVDTLYIFLLCDVICFSPFKDTIYIPTKSKSSFDQVVYKSL